MVLTVTANGESYPVHIDEGGFAGLGASIRSRFPSLERVVCIVDGAVEAAHGAAIASGLRGMDAPMVSVVGGEGAKTIATWERVVHSVLDCGVDRRTPIVAIGGGSVGDLAGFVAASVMRGVPLVQVPTTLLAMVDSSVGGKTGLNAPQGKNLIGAFHQPSLVHIALGALPTLPEPEYRSGLGEVVKHAVLGDRALFDFCNTQANAVGARDPAGVRYMVTASVNLKAAIVAEDVREQGWRSVLNLGHTVGHAVETIQSRKQRPIPHGMCVGMGLFAEVYWSEQRGECPAGTARRVQDTLLKLGLPDLPEEFDINAALDVVKFDKKVRRGTLTTAVVEDVGRVRLASVSEDEFPAMFSAFEDA